MTEKLKLLMTHDSNEQLTETQNALIRHNITTSFSSKDGEELIAKICSLLPDVVMMDLFMTRVDAIGVMRTIKQKELSKTPMFIVYSSFDSPVLEREVMSSGATYFVLKPYNIDDLYGCQFFLKNAFYLTGGIGGCFSTVRFDQINNSFRLGKIKLSVEKCPFCEFAALGRPRTSDIQCFQSGRQYSRGAVAMKFHGILTGVAVRAPGVDDAAGIDDPSLLVVKLAQHHFPVRNVRNMPLAIQCKNFVRDFGAVITGEPDDADGRNHIAGRNGSNRL